MLAALAVPAVLALARPRPVPQGAAELRAVADPRDTDGFFAALYSGDPERLATWLEAHDARVTWDAVRLARAFLASEAEDPAAFDDYRRALASAADAIGARPPAELLRRVLGWDAAARATFARLASEVEAAAPPRPEQLARLRSELEALDASGLLLAPLARLARPLYDAGQRAQAIEWVRWIGARAERVDDPWQLSWAEEWLGRVHWEHGDLQLARTHLGRALAVDARLGAPGYQAKLLVDLASLELGAGALGAGLEHAEEGHARALEAHDTPLALAALEARAGLLLELGEHEQALEMCRRLADDPACAPAVGVRADLLAANALSELGRLESAWTYTRRALDAAAAPELVERDPELLASVRLEAGLLLGDLGRIDEGLEQLERAREVFTRRASPRGVGWAQKNRGWLLARAGRHEQALAAFAAGEAAGRAVASPFLEAWCALGAAEAAAAAASAAGELDAHDVPRRLDLAARTAELLADRHLEWRVAAARGRCLELAGDPEGALQRYAEALARIERERRRVDLPGLRTHFLRDRSAPYRRAALLAARLGRDDEALRTSELLRARVARERNERRGAPSREASPPVRAARHRLAELGAALQALPIHGGEDERARLARELRDAEGALDAALLDAELDGHRTPLPGTSSGDGPTAAELPGRVRAAGLDAVLAYLVDERETLLVTATPRGVQVARLPVGRAALANDVARLRAPIERLHAGTLDLAHLDFDVEAARRLYDELLAPAALLPRTRVGVVADECLTSLPLELLVAGGRCGPGDLEHPFRELTELEYAGDRHAFVYVGALALLGAAPHEPLGEVTAFAPPAGVGVPSGADELAALERALGASHVRVVRDATVADLRALAPGADAIHVAAHGLTDAAYPTHGHLLLGGEDGAARRLEAWEIEELALDARLVVLSACHTGEGRWTAGEGLIGLTRAFVGAGAREVVASLWTVDDRATVRWMNELYAALVEELDPIDALARTRRRWAHSLEGTNAHPYSWAGWVLHR